MNKQDFPILQHAEKNGKKLAYLDSAASSQVPTPVIEAMKAYYETSHANVHRGVYDLSEKSTELYEEARETVAQFINAKGAKEIIFTANATASLNMIAQLLGNQLRKGDEIVLTMVEHHSNLVPWQQVAKKTGAVLKFIPLTDDKQLDLQKAKELITKKTKVVAFTHISNVLGTITPVKELVSIAKEHNVLTVLDACQSVPRLPLDVQELDVDFLVFSAHKMCGPTGIGVLYGKQELLQDLPPLFTGGGMVKIVEQEQASWADLPEKFEAGTPNIVGAVGLKAAIEYLQNIGMEKIGRHEEELTRYLYDELSRIEGITLHSPKDCSGVVSFNCKNVHAHDVATILNDQNVAVRAGNHCAQPLMKKLEVNATLRASVYLYNDKDDVDRLIAGLHKTFEVFSNE